MRPLRSSAASPCAALPSCRRPHRVARPLCAPSRGTCGLWLDNQASIGGACVSAAAHLPSPSYPAASGPQTTIYVAETWNTLSNIMIFLPCVFYGFPMCSMFNLPRRFQVSFALLALVGVGSWAFHMTLLHTAQVGCYQGYHRLVCERKAFSGVCVCVCVCVCESQRA